MCPKLSSRVGAEWRPGERNPRRRTSARVAPLPTSKAQCFLYSRPANHGRDLRALLVLSRLRNSRVLDVPGRRLDRPYYCSSALGGGLSPGASPLQALLAAVRTRLTSCTEGGPRISTTRGGGHGRMARFFISRGAAAMYRRAAVIPGRPPTAEEEGLRQSDSRRVRAPHGGAGRSGPPALASGPIDRRLTPPLMSLKSLRKERRPETPVHSWRLRPRRRTYSCKRPHNRDQGDPAPRRCVVDVGLQRLRKKRGRTGKGDGAGSSGQLRRKTP